MNDNENFIITFHISEFFFKATTIYKNKMTIFSTICICKLFIKVLKIIIRIIFFANNFNSSSESFNLSSEFFNSFIIFTFMLFSTIFTITSSDFFTFLLQQNENCLIHDRSNSLLIHNRLFHFFKKCLQ
jgi:hypothetical protein